MTSRRKVRATPTPNQDGKSGHSHSIRFDHETWEALTKAARLDERDPSRFIKLLVRKELRSRGLLAEQKV